MAQSDLVNLICFSEEIQALTARPDANLTIWLNLDIVHMGLGDRVRLSSGPNLLCFWGIGQAVFFGPM
jgi:hypothetical protein